MQSGSKGNTVETSVRSRHWSSSSSKRGEIGLVLSVSPGDRWEMNQRRNWKKNALSNQLNSHHAGPVRRKNRVDKKRYEGFALWKEKKKSGWISQNNLPSRRQEWRNWMSHQSAARISGCEAGAFTERWPAAKRTAGIGSSCGKCVFL